MIIISVHCFVYEKLSDNYDTFNASRQKYDFDLDYLFAGPDLDKNNSGSASEGGRKAISEELITIIGEVSF